MMTIQNCLRAMLGLLFVTASAGRSQNVLAVPAQFSSIQAAINAAFPGDTVLVAPGTYFERIDFIGKAITVQGTGAGVTFIDAGQLGSGVTFQNQEGPGSILDGFTVTNGTGTLLAPGLGITPFLCGGGIYISGVSVGPWPAIQPTIRNCEISGNTAKYGAGVYGWNRALVSLINCVISGNQAVYAPGTPISSAGGIQTTASSGILLDGCLVSGNSAGSCGGVCAAGAGVLVWQDTIRNSIISQNSAFVGTAGGAYINGGGPAAPVLVQNCPTSITKDRQRRLHFPVISRVFPIFL